MKTNWTKRMLCLVLSAALLLGHIPASAFAEEETVPPEETVAEEVTEAPSEPTEVTEPEPSEPEITEPETSEPTEPTEETTEPAEETQPEIPEVESVEEWVIPDVEGWPSDEELYAIYAEGLLYGNVPATFGTAAGERLTGNTKLAYDALKPVIQQIARGERQVTKIVLGYSHENIILNGVQGDYMVDIEVPFVGTEFDSTALMYALLADMPYELYWFDKTTGMGNSYFSVNNQLQWTVYFPVAGNYGPGSVAGGYCTDLYDTSAAATAVENAASVVAAAANLSDYEKLVYYRDYICNAVSYDWDAYYGSMEDDTYFMFHIDSWQVVNVFDGYTDTNVVCEGYSKAFQYLCDLTDFDGDVVCYSVSGTMNGGGHMWNIVSIDGASYLVDVTNSDTGMTGQNGGLFLVGGPVANGGYSFTIGSQEVRYLYDSDMESLLGSDVITLSTNAQYEPPVEEAACAHTFSDGSCTKCGILGGTCGTNVYWTFDEATHTLTIFGQGDMTEYRYSSSVPWSNYDTIIQHIVVEEGVTSIGKYAFYDCTGTEISLPEGITSIGDYAFYACNAAEIILPEGITRIGYDAFGFCINLVEITIPEGVTEIGDFAFYYCSALEKVTLSEDVTSIGNKAFIHCSALETIVFEGSCPAFGESVFEGVTATAYYPANNATWTSDVMQNYGGTITWVAAGGCSHSWTDATCTVPKTCTECGDTEGEALGHRVYFDKVVEYDPLTVKNEDAIPFVLTDGTYYSGNHDHNSSSELRIVAVESCELTLNYGVSSESNYDKLYILHNDTEQVMISGSITDESLTLTLAAGDIVTVRYTKDGSQHSGQDQGWVTLDYENCSYGVGDVPADILRTDCTHDVVCTYCDTVVKKAPGHNTVIDEKLEPTCKDDGLTEGSHCSVCGEVFTAQEVIPATGEHNFVDDACTGCGIYGGQCGENVYWIFEEDPDTDGSNGVLTVYGEGPMYDFEHSIWEDFYPYKPFSIHKIVMEEGVTSIGNRAFGGCENLTEVVFPEGITRIGDGAFGGCRRLTEIAIPEGVTSIGNWAFDYCENLTSVVIPGSVTTIGSCAFNNCPNLQSVTLSEGLETIGEEAFTLCMSLTSIEIPGTVTSLGERVFDECRNLTEIILCEGIPAIGEGVFYGCGVTSIEIPGSVKRIGSDAFARCENLTEVILNEGLETIDDRAFVHSGLKEIVLPESITDFSGAFIECFELEKVVLPENLTAIGEQAFLFCRSLTDIVIPENVTSIGGAAFAECSALTEILIPGSVASIGENAFVGCTGLETLVISEGAAEIGVGAFSYCTALTEVVIPESVATVGKSAFADCSGLEKVVFRGNVTDIGEYAFNGCSSLTEIVFPEDITYIDTGMLKDCTSLTEIVIPEKVVLIENSAFSGCTALKEITFPGNAPAIDGDVFIGVTATAYYPADNATWTGDKLQNYGGNITWLPIGAQPPVAQIGGNNYTSLDQALAAAKKGDTVTLMADAEVTDLLIRSGVTVDLGEFDLTANSVIGFKGGVIQATPNAGRLIVPKGNLILSEAGVNEKGQSILPVWDPVNENYVFSLFIANTGNAARGLFIKEAEDSLYFQWKHQATGAINSGLLGDNGSSDNDVSMLVRLQWGDKDGVAYQNYVFKDEFVQKVTGSNDYTVTLKGIETLGIDLKTLVVTAIITTESGAETVGTAWTIENAK